MAKYVAVRDGMEFGVEENVGRIIECKYKFGDRNARITLDVEGLSIDVSASVEVARTDLWPVVQDAQDNDRRVAFRIEIHRNLDKVAPETLFADVPDFDRFRRLEWVAVVARDGIVNAPTLVVDQHPAAVGARSTGAPSPTPRPPAAPAPQAAGNPADPRGDGALGVPGARARFAQPEDAPPVCPLCGNPLGVAQVRKYTHSRFAHKACWEAERDGVPIPSNGAGSAATATRPAPALSLGMVSAAHELLATLSAPDKPKPAHVKALAAFLLLAAAKAERLVLADDRTSHLVDARALCHQAVRAALASHPVPMGGEPEVREVARQRWVDELAAYAVMLVHLSAELGSAGVV